MVLIKIGGHVWHCASCLVFFFLLSPITFFLSLVLTLSFFFIFSGGKKLSKNGSYIATATTFIYLFFRSATKVTWDLAAWGWQRDVLLEHLEISGISTSSLSTPIHSCSLLKVYRFVPTPAAFLICLCTALLHQPRLCLLLLWTLTNPHHCLSLC